MHAHVPVERNCCLKPVDMCRTSCKTSVATGPRRVQVCRGALEIMFLGQGRAPISVPKGKDLGIAACMKTSSSCSVRMPKRAWKGGSSHEIKLRELISSRSPGLRAYKSRRHGRRLPARAGAGGACAGGQWHAKGALKAAAAHRVAPRSLLGAQLRAS